MKPIKPKQSGFTLVELIVSVALFLVAITIALYATIGTNGLVIRTDARSVIAEGGRVINDVLRRTVVNAPVGSVSLLNKYSTTPNYAGVQVKTYAWDQNQNVCQIIGRAASSVTDNKESFTLDPAGTAMAIWVYPLDSGLHCPSLTTPTLYQNRLTDKDAIVQDFQTQFITVTCQPGVANCTTKQQLRYKFILQVATAGRGKSAETKRPSIEVDSSIPIGLINESIAGPDLITASLPHGVAGQTYSLFAFIAVGGTPNYTWSSSGGSLPSGMSFNANGVLSGTPCSSCAGTTNLTYTVKDSSNPQRQDSRILTLVIDATPALTITTTSPLPAGITNTPYTTTLAGSGGAPAYVWSLASGSTLPGALQLNSSSGTISGNLSVAVGVYTFTIQLSDSDNHTTTKNFSLRVEEPTAS